MSVSGNVVSVLAGAGGSFPVAGIRAKITRQRLYTSSGVWIAPANCYYVQLAMCGGGGSGAVVSDNSGSPTGSVANGGAGAAVIVPGLIPVLPGISYTVTVGAGGASATATLSAANGASGGTSIFAGGLTYFATQGGVGGGVGGGAAAGGTTVQGSSYGLLGVNGGNGARADFSPSAAGAVEHSIGGTSVNSYRGGGGASLFAAGGNSGDPTSTKPGFGAGSGGAFAFDVAATSGAGGNGVVIVTWEE
jgi:hypothetical protein